MQVESKAPLTPVVSLSVTLQPIQRRCRYWAKIVRASSPLPLPCDVQGAQSVAGRYLTGDEELFPGDVLIEGEEVSHRKTRGWVYWVTFITPEGEHLRYASGFGPLKQAAKKLGLPAELLAGSGDVAGAVRVGHALRIGLKL